MIYMLSIILYLDQHLYQCTYIIFIYWDIKIFYFSLNLNYYKFISEFGSDSPQTRLYAETFLFDLPFYDMNTNACLYTNCPMVKNTEQNWLYNLFISTNYPSASFTIKLKLWDGGPEAQGDDQCCFKFDIKIV